MGESINKREIIVLIKKLVKITKHACALVNILTVFFHSGFAQKHQDFP